MSYPYAKFIVIRKDTKMAYSSEAYDLLDSALEVLKAKRGKYAHSYMLGLLMPNIDLVTAVRITNMILEMEVQND